MILPRSDKCSLLRRELYAMLNGETEQAYQQLESSRAPRRDQLVLDRNGKITQQPKDMYRMHCRNEMSRSRTGSFRLTFLTWKWTLYKLLNFDVCCCLALNVQNQYVETSSNATHRFWNFQRPLKLFIVCKQELTQPVDF